MKKKLNAVIAVLLSVACLPVASMSASAYSVRMTDSVVIEKDAFQYNSGIQEDAEMVDAHGCYLNLTDVDANFMVSGVFQFESGRKYYTLSPVNEINEVNAPELVKSGTVAYYLFGTDTRGAIESMYLDALLDGKKLAIGDLVKIQHYNTMESRPLQYSVVSTPEDCDLNGNPVSPSAEYVGNALEMFGEDFKDVLVNEMYIAPNYLIGQSEVRNGYELIDSNHIVKKGDVTQSGEVGIVDVLAVNQALLSLRSLSAYGELAGDVNHNGTIDDGDAVKILKSLVDLETLD